jgi:hypothetical protein
MNDWIGKPVGYRHHNSRDDDDDDDDDTIQFLFTSVLS